MLQSLSYNIFGDLSPITLQARRTFPHTAGSAGPALRVGSHSFPAGIVGLILVLRLHLFRDAVEHFVRLLLIEFFLFVFFHVLTSRIVWHFRRENTRGGSRVKCLPVCGRQAYAHFRFSEIKSSASFANSLAASGITRSSKSNVEL